PGPGGCDRRRGPGADTDHGAVRVQRGTGERARHPGRPGLVAGTGRGPVTERGPVTGRGPVAPGSGWPGGPASQATPVAATAAQVRALAAEAAAAGSLAEVAARQSVCRACPRLVEWRETPGAGKRAATPPAKDPGP